MAAPMGRSEVRLAELVALLSLGTDLGLGQPMEHIVRACLIALRLGEQLHLDEPERSVVYYSGLLAWVGCHTDAYEQAKWLGDDMAAKRDAHYSFDFGRASHSAAFIARHIGGSGRPFVERARVGIGFLGEGRKALLALAENHYRAADGLVGRLGLGDRVRAALRQTYERWDGKGAYHEKGEDILISSRLMNLADVVEVAHRIGGLEAAISVARERSGTQFDPALVELFSRMAPAIFEGLDSAASWDEVIAAEPALGTTISGEKLDDALEAIADFTDLKSPWTIGHSRGVASLAGRAAETYGLPRGDLETLRRAALLHDIGRLGIPNSIWDKRGKLTQAELERVRLHPYLTERMLAFAAGLAHLGAVAIQHHERLDGSGYPRGLTGNAISPSGRVLAAADVYHALTEMRPHREALPDENSANELRAEVTAGRLDGDAVAAVLRAAGHRVGHRREWPSGLTAREVEVLRLLARGLSSKEIAARLVISPKTSRNHVEHIYAKLGVSNRAQASLFAVEHGLMTG